MFEMVEDDKTDKVVMDVALLREFVTEPKQKLVYLFDFFTERGFFIELVDTIDDNSNPKHLALTASKEEAPEQLQMDIDLSANLLEEKNQWNDDFCMMT